MTETSGDPTTDAPSTDSPSTEDQSTEASEAQPTTSAPTFDPPEYVFVGGYTDEMGGTAKGLTMYGTGAGSDGSGAEAADAGTVAAVASLGLASPSYVIKHPSKPWLYAVHESSPGQVSAIRYDDDGLHLINTVDSGGDGGCHLCFDHSGDFLVVAHYTSGSIASFALEPNGALSERKGLLEFSGSGPDAERQSSAHAHQVVSVGQAIMVPDLGSDAVHIVRIDDAGELTPAGDSIKLPDGSGPRHLVVSGRHLVVACELSATLWVGALDAAVGAAGNSVPTSTKQTEERIYPSALVAYGDQLVVANRGADTLGIFTLDAFGTPHPLTEIDCGGSWPRDVTVDGEQLWVSNQQSDTVSVIKPAAVSNRPEDWPVVHQLSTGAPARVIPTR
ncbi:lactonase family protein [Microlunatus soli]|uniref:6-phosphogluconolactonase, cycloisomerase 2 family n=1 Tax=Microlunatus soli TaxID=630515 RepID=A0A1H1NYC3_9ACTN|nr:beta-propeller fold lactonase family protein [Microlunatus soli]SDS03952.1 6-phosphogluconolactonase, cycloisomerase 2 family [Microlunatus soli]